MLKKLSVKNLGCFDEQAYTMVFSPETLIAGPNNSGKSMFISGINLIKHFIVTGSIAWSTELYNFFSFQEAVNAHQRDKTIEVSMTVTEDSFEYNYEFHFSEKGNRFLLNGQPCKRTSKDVELMSKLWFFRPNRSPVPFYSPVEPTASLLQPLRPDGSNVINYLLERWTDRDKRWNEAETWLRKIDPDMTEIKTPIRGNRAYFETMFGNIPVNVSLQGSGFQSAAAIIAALVFSPECTTIIIEEPEVFLHPDSQEVIVDMINEAVNNHKKQVIFSTHSCNILLPFYNDISLHGAKRGATHVKANPDKFTMWTFKKVAGKVSIEHYPLQNKTFQQFRADFKQIWG